MLELILSMTIWGTLGVFVLWSGMSAIDVAFYRCLLGAILIGCWLIRAKHKISLDRYTVVVAVAGICLVLNWVLLFKSFQVSTITIGNISYYLQPIMLIILGIFFYHEKVSVQKWALILLALCGVLLTIDIHQLTSPHVLLGVFFALLAALLYSFLTLLMKRVHMSFFASIFIQLTIGVVILLPFTHFHPLPVKTLSCLIIIGVIHTLLAYFLYYKAIKKTSFTQIAIVSYLDPMVAIAADVVFFNRQLNLSQMAGVILTFSALYWLVTASRQAPVPARG